MLFHDMSDSGVFGRAVSYLHLTGGVLRVEGQENPIATCVVEGVSSIEVAEPAAGEVPRVLCQRVRTAWANE